jgi:hypothetical protein
LNRLARRGHVRRLRLIGISARPGGSYMEYYTLYGCRGKRRRAVKGGELRDGEVVAIEEDPCRWAVVLLALSHDDGVVSLNPGRLGPGI